MSIDVKVTKDIIIEHVCSKKLYIMKSIFYRRSSL